MRLEGGGKKGRVEETGMAYGRNGPHLRGRHPRRANTSSFLKDMALWNSLCSFIHTTILNQGSAGMRTRAKSQTGAGPTPRAPRSPRHHLHGAMDDQGALFLLLSTLKYTTQAWALCV